MLAEVTASMSGSNAMLSAREKYAIRILVVDEPTSEF
jgi:hypothetical protein